MVYIGGEGKGVEGEGVARAKVSRAKEAALESLSTVARR